MPSSDIEANIRKLEKTQAKINAALEAFRSMKADEEPSSALIDLSSANAAMSMSRPLTVKQSSRTAPAKMRQNSFSTKSSDSSGIKKFTELSKTTFLEKRIFLGPKKYFFSANI